jgi:hypothetical protein
MSAWLQELGRRSPINDMRRARSYVELARAAPGHAAVDIVGLDVLLDPLVRALKSCPDDVREVCLSGLSVLLEQYATHRCSTPWLLGLVDEVAKLLQQRREAQNVGSSVMEERQLEMVRVIRSALRSLASATQEPAFWNEFMHRGLLGFALAQLLDCSNNGKLRALRLEGLGTACNLFRSMLDGDMRVAAAFFPGFASTLHRVACGDFKQGREATELALTELAHVCVRLLPQGAQCDALQQLQELASINRMPQPPDAGPLLPAAPVVRSERADTRPTFSVTLDPEWARISSSKMMRVIGKVRARENAVMSSFSRVHTHALKQGGALRAPHVWRAAR